MERAVAYIRVSTKSDAQLHSYEYQLEYWKNSISNEYEFKGVYADWGISGRSLAKRNQLLQLLKDAEEHKFDKVFTKSVSRLGRNLPELMQVVRALRDLGISVFFENERIDSFEPNADSYIELAATVAEHDLRTYADNQHWSYIQRFRKGEAWFGHQVFGYEIDYKNSTLLVKEDEAQIVRKIFELYINGHGFASIARILSDDNTEWKPGRIKSIIENEKYIGNSLCQKTYTTIDGVKKLNRGEKEQYYIEHSHEAIIDKETFNKAQEIRKKRTPTKLYEQKQTLYDFTGKIYCGVCGHKFNHKINNSNFDWKTDIWICHNKAIYGNKKCDSSAIKDSVLKEQFVSAYNEFIERFKNIEEDAETKERIDSLLKQENELNSLRVNRLIDPDTYNKEISIITKELENLSFQLSNKKIRNIRKSDIKIMDEYNPEKIDKFVEKIIITKYKVAFHFIEGIVIERDYTNGKSGHKKGWNK